MRVMWVLSEPTGSCASIFDKNDIQNGAWIDACSIQTYNYRQEGSLELHIVAISNKDDSLYTQDDLIHYYLIDVDRKQGKRNGIQYLEKWRDCINRINPSIIQIWGTELPIGLDVITAADRIPVIFFIQGIMKVIYEHPYGDLRLRELLKGSDLLFIPKLLHAIYANRRVKRQAKIEKQMIESSAGIIVDSDWAAAQYIDCGKPSYKVPLAINQLFTPRSWNIQNCKKHTIFTVYGRNPIKGLHILLKAVAEVKKYYPDVTLYIPGSMSRDGLKRLIEPMYIKYIERKIKKYNLKDNVIYTGRLTQLQMFEKMRDSNVFVMPSCVENHSSTLREAMTVGCPCITSVVGSILEYAIHNENSFLYRYDDYSALAFYIKKVFDDDVLAQNLGLRASDDICEKYNQNQIGTMLMDTYNSVLNIKHE